MKHVRLVLTSLNGNSTTAIQFKGSLCGMEPMMVFRFEVVGKSLVVKKGAKVNL